MARNSGRRNRPAWVRRSRQHLTRRRGSAETRAEDGPPLQLSGCHPTLKRLLRLARAPAVQETLHADILVQSRPMDSSTAANKTRLGPLFGGTVGKSREPCERYDNCPAVRQVHGESVVAHGYALSDR